MKAVRVVTFNVDEERTILGYGSAVFTESGEETRMPGNSTWQSAAGQAARDCLPHPVVAPA